MSEPLLLVLAPLALEALALRLSARGVPILIAGMGPARAKRAAVEAAASSARALAIVGFCGALDPSLRPGDIVAADRLLGPGETVELGWAESVAAALRAGGLAPFTGSVLTSDRLVRGEERRRLQNTGALAVDMESWHLAGAARGRPLAVVRAVVDTSSRELFNPFATAWGGMLAFRALFRSAPALQAWARQVDSAAANSLADAPERSGNRPPSF